MENTQSVINPNVTNLATDCNYLEEEFWLTPQIVVWYCDGDKKKAHCADKYYSRWAWDGNRDRTPPVKVTWTHPAFWRSWNRALAFLINNRSRYKGLGIVLPYPYLQKRVYTCVDLDWKHLPGPTPLQLEILAAFIGKTYIEWSPSGLGVHIWFRGTIGNCRRGKEVEIYSHSRFLTITRQPYMDETGNIIGNVPFADIQLN